MSRLPLSKTEIVGRQILVDFVPSLMAENTESFFIAKAIQAGKETGIAKVFMAVWPDDTWALVGYNPDWTRPREEQLLRTYRKAFAAGLLIPGLYRSASSGVQK